MYLCVFVCLCVRQCECYFHISYTRNKFSEVLYSFNFIKHTAIQEILKQAIILYFVSQALQSPIWGRLDLVKPYLSL